MPKTNGCCLWALILMCWVTPTHDCHPIPPFVECIRRPCLGICWVEDTSKSPKSNRRSKVSWLLKSQDTLLEQHALFISLKSRTHCKIARFLSVTPGCQTICVGIQFWALFKMHEVWRRCAQDTICWHFSGNFLTGTWHCKPLCEEALPFANERTIFSYNMNDCIRGVSVFLKISSDS